LKDTYSWGNKANTRGWNKNQPEDIKAANEAIKDKYNGEKIGGPELDPFIDKAFNKLNKKENEHANWGILNNCKAEAGKLEGEAKKMLDDSNKKE
jgi:hypothetical protein